ncbi:PREDICTED: receptor-like serine/threonine-protein kinase At4g25390 [Nicotiana attenuata]|uniref:non-specific serine/threonine protein kinase n=1 Tax=Nicotiana attenuata TaxID=49451 RepID=A0A314KNG5_NICAT|nr:PREDICTED: receptor-like serine/threonine-protein kinase At4g25390 [Nicotiana attenuata]OIT30981.1 receptor-like serinethreonine-protein kinase [Nicotiana attenuata]
MPSRELRSLPPTPTLSQPVHRQRHHLLPPLAGGIAAAASLLILFTFCFRKISLKKTVPSSDSESNKKPPHRFSYSSLRRATCNFSPALRLGQGGFGSVYSGTLKSPTSNNVSVAVKVMDSGSLQGEREFQNELFLSGKIDSKYIVSTIGFSSDKRGRRMLLVYELLSNGSLQDCLLHRKCSELKDWKKRYSIALDIAKGLEYLHHFCDPPVIHGDIKPSNILLDDNFNAKIGDFGLARLKSEDQVEIEVKRESHVGGNGVVEDNGSVAEEMESVSVVTVNGFEEFHRGVEQSPESVVIGVELSPEAHVVSPRTVADMVSPSECIEKTSLSEGIFDRSSIDSGIEIGDKKSGVKKNKKKKSVTGKDWWWKQDTGGTDSGVVKDYVMEWIGNEIKKERPKTEWIGASSSSGVVGITEKKHKKRLDWWVSLDDEKNVKKEKRRPAREWWKEEYCEELARKKKKKKKQQGGIGSVSDDCHSDSWWARDDELYADRKKKRSRSRSSKSSMDWWLDGFSSELRRARKNSYDSASGDIPKSGGISSTPSMRGTVCYVAPEYGSCGDLSEKCDVYSYGVLLLVLIAGRRPLQVTGSPMSEFQRANLLSWARHLARAGKLLDLVDQSVESLDKEQALLCITVALRCLQKSPARRPSMKEVVGMLSGDLEAPQLPVELSPSPPSRFPFKSHKKVR